ncbi:hypothetical protein T07_4769 [Trichinella nelsoni]|uniref:Uncharacterized protein n=1 Tax=Trichinella nelsoni TaxID=6336 RepID=A0A0V0RTN2_9BILA|nr:hypothetical protein T07_4769 [Trichinella nelsoni]
MLFLLKAVTTTGHHLHGDFIDKALKNTRLPVTDVFHLTMIAGEPVCRANKQALDCFQWKEQPIKLGLR